MSNENIPFDDSPEPESTGETIGFDEIEIVDLTVSDDIRQVLRGLASQLSLETIGQFVTQGKVMNDGSVEFVIAIPGEEETDEDEGPRAFDIPPGAWRRKQ